MTANAILEDTALAALISSKICHDLAGQIGAINNGLELLEEENDEDTRYYALELIQNSAKAAWAQLDFNRLAFGVASSLGAVVPLADVEQVARRYVKQASANSLAGQCPERRKRACQASAGGVGCFSDGAPRRRRLLCWPSGDEAEGTFEVPAQIDYPVPRVRLRASRRGLRMSLPERIPGPSMGGW